MILPVAKITDRQTAIDKKNKGAISAEYQIMKNNRAFDESILNVLQVTSVHTELSDGCDVELDRCFSSDYISSQEAELNIAKLINAFTIAEICGVTQSIIVKVVVHLGSAMLTVPYYVVISTLEDLFKTYPHCAIAIENTMQFGSEGNIRTACVAHEVPSFVRELRNRIALEYKNRIFSVLDVCHALSTIRIRNEAYKNADISREPELKYLEQYFLLNSEICGIIHFNNAVDFGIGEKAHGVAFNSAYWYDISLMQTILMFYNRYIPTASFVIEIREEDYSNSVNFKTTIEQLKKYVK